MMLLPLLPSWRDVTLTYKSGRKKLDCLHLHSMAINRSSVYVSSQTGAGVFSCSVLWGIRFFF